MKPTMNAGIIRYRESKVPQVLSVLSQPRLESNAVLSFEDRDIEIFIFDCPVSTDKLDKKRYRLLNDLVNKNKIKFLVERFDAQVKSNVTPKKKEVHYSQLLNEVKAIKQLAVLIKLSQEREDNLLKSQMGFIMDEIDYCTMDLLSDEASGVMVYESPNLSEQLKAKLHNDFMKKKGVSIVFTKDIRRIIHSTDILSIDEKAELGSYTDMLKEKLVLGCSSSALIRTIKDVILWNEELNLRDQDSVPILYNNEILAIIRYNFIKLDIIEFIKLLPYIYYQK